jgi:IS30 family transposase
VSIDRIDKFADKHCEQSIKLSHECIYQMIWQDKRDDLWCSLRRRGKRYHKRAAKNVGRGLILDRIDIRQRPAIVARKTRLGDWEDDTVVGTGHKGGSLTLSRAQNPTGQNH